MKRIVGVSIGSAQRNHTVQLKLAGDEYVIERIGTDGDISAAIEIIKDLDGKVDAFGLGGIDRYLCCGNRRYELKDGKRIALAATRTPIVDGSGLKDTLERRVIRQLSNQGVLGKQPLKILMVCGMDRFGMAEELDNLGHHITFGDLIFALGIPMPVYSLRRLNKIAQMVMPIVCRLPFQMLYPTGVKQESIEDKFHKYYQTADVVAGDFHFIRRHMPKEMKGKTILTNTVTKADIDLLKERGVSRLITTTPELAGRSFGTNVMEALLVSYIRKKEKSVAYYDQALAELDWRPRIVELQREEIQGWKG